MPANDSEETSHPGEPAPLVLERDFEANIERVFEAFSSAERLARWFPPDGFEMRDAVVEFRPGGALRFNFVGHGMSHGYDGRFLEIVRPSRIVFAGVLPDGNRVQATIELTSVANGTRLQLCQRFSIAEAMSTKGAPIGWGQSLDHLARDLA